MSHTSQVTQEFTCLYTKHKTRKRKIWHDGRLVLYERKAALYETMPSAGCSGIPLDECEVTEHERKSLLQRVEARLETEKFIVQVEDLWTPVPAVADESTRSKSVKTKNHMSNSMKKLLNQKFKRPAARIPNQPNVENQRIRSAFAKRKRPLQPGELLRLHGRQQKPVTPKSPVNSQRNSSSNKKSSQSNPDGVYYENVGYSHTGGTISRLNRLPDPEQTKSTCKVSNDSKDPTPPNKPKTSRFVSNEFDSVNFYGYEESEKEEHASTATDTEGTGLLVARTAGRAQRNSPLQSTELESISGNDLLALFGATCAPETSKSFIEGRPVPSTDDAFGVRGKRLDEFNDSIDFTLPPASQSSSDDSSSKG